MTEELFSQSEAEQMVGCDTVAQEGCKSGVSAGTTGRVVGAQRHATDGWVLTVEWRAKDAGDMFYGILGELSINLFRSSQTIREQFSKPEFEKHVRCISFDHS